MDTLIIEEATKKFGQVVDSENGVLLIKRQTGNFANPNAKYMTIKGGTNENGVGFHDGQSAIFELSDSLALSKALKKLL